jgi:hypothetical protein
MVDAPNFNAEKDAEALRGSVKGLGKSGLSSNVIFIKINMI